MLQLHFDCQSVDGTPRRVIIRFLRPSGVIIDIQTETSAGFISGTSGDPELDAALHEHVARFARHSSPPYRLRSQSRWTP